MGSPNLPGSPAEDSKANKVSGKATKPGGAGLDGRPKRVRKACERCRAKKTKCDGDFPCKRCKIYGLICTAAIRKETEYKQLPRGYAEVLENTQLTLTATIHKLYSMVRSSQPWELGEPGIDDRGQPVLHNIAQILGCTRHNHDHNFSVDRNLLEDESSTAELARQLKKEQPHEHDAMGANSSTASTGNGESSAYNCADRASFSKPDQSHTEQNYCKMAFGNHDTSSLFPQYFASGSDFESGTTTMDFEADAMFSTLSSFIPAYSCW
ncbi:Fluconazole resistance protein 1 [Beauveria bassiana]|nr:Fluconazole resistance protein 1 [Beauveria bassiana]KAH8716558.1 Fluconazole resistance protein 1 [Beauveria bassiana]